MVWIKDKAEDEQFRQQQANLANLLEQVATGCKNTIKQMLYRQLKLQLAAKNNM